jgi:uncharacterized protein (TIGR03437 family)
MIPSKRETCCKRLTGAAIVLAGSVILSSCCVVYNESKECIQYASPAVVLQMLGDYYGKDDNHGLDLIPDVPLTPAAPIPERPSSRPASVKTQQVERASALLSPNAATDSSCPGVNFLQGGVMPLASNSWVAGLQRQPDGSFNSWEYEALAPFSLLQSIPAVFNCSVSGAPAFKNPPGWTFLEPKLGITSQPTLFANLLGNGTPVGLAIVPAGFMAEGIFVGQPATASLLVAIPNANGTAKSFTFYSVPSGAQSILTGDFNNDGKLDVVVIGSSNSNGIAVYLGKGDGTLQSPNFFSGHQATIQAVAYDFNGDGKLDLAVVNGATNDVSVQLAKGDGTFAAANNYPAGVTGAGQIVAGDFNGDGHEDLAVSGASSISVLLNNGQGAFGAPINQPLEFNYISGLAAGDFNKDGRLDLALTDSAGGTVSILLGNGSGEFSGEFDYAAGAAPSGLFAMDLDGDGNLDVVIASGHPDVLIPNQSSQFMTALPGNGDGSLNGPPTYHTGGSPSAIATADFNSDGKLDIVSAAGQLWIGLADQFPVSINLGSGVSASGVAAADVNGDGKPDIVVGDANGSGIYVLLGKGDGTFQAPVKYSTGGDVNSLAIADFNGDGKPDIAFCGFLNALPPVGAAGILFGNGDGTFQAVSALTGFGSSPGSLAVGDFNNDGKPDLAIADQGYRSLTGGVNVYLNKGGGTFQTPASYTVGQYPVFIAAANLNGGHAPDLIVSTQDPNYNTNGQWDVAVLLANGDGTFKAPSYLATQTNPNAIAIADLNGDGKPDLAIGHCCAGSSITYMLGNGDGTFQAEAAVPTQVEATALAAANLTGNKGADLIAGIGLRVGYISIFPNLRNLGAVVAAPAITLVANAEGGAPVIAPNTWVEINGSNLAPAGDTRIWAGSDFVGDKMPTNLDGVSVTVSGAPAYIYYISPTQVNVLTPPGALSGQVNVVLTNGTPSTAFSVHSQAESPSFFVVNGGLYIIATHADGSLIGPSTLYPGYTTPAAAGETIVIYANGFGPTSVPVVPGAETQSGTLSPPPTITINGVAAKVEYAGLSSAPGEFQFNVVVPLSLSSGDQAIVAKYKGQTTQSGTLITIK